MHNEPISRTMNGRELFTVIAIAASLPIGLALAQPAIAACEANTSVEIAGNPQSYSVEHDEQVGADVSTDTADSDTFDCSELVEWAGAQPSATVPDGSSNQHLQAKEATPPNDDASNQPTSHRDVAPIRITERIDSSTPMDGPEEKPATAPGPTIRPDARESAPDDAREIDAAEDRSDQRQRR